MKEFEIDKEEGYFIGPSPIGRNKNMSLRAKGLMYVFFTLPPEWDYSLNGLTSICKEGRDVIKNTLNELKVLGYLEIIKNRSDKGTYKYKYIVHRKSIYSDLEMNNHPKTEKPGMVKPEVVNQPQLNINNKIDKIDKTNDHTIYTNELIKYNYIGEDELSSFLFDDLFNEYINNGYSKKELMMSIHYIIPRIIDKNYLDEFGNKITNKYGYFKNALESNFIKLSNNTKELYTDDYINDLQKEFDEVR